MLVNASDRRSRMLEDLQMFLSDNLGARWGAGVVGWPRRREGAGDGEHFPLVGATASAVQNRPASTALSSTR